MPSTTSSRLFSITGINMRGRRNRPVDEIKDEDDELEDDEDFDDDDDALGD